MNNSTLFNQKIAENYDLWYETKAGRYSDRIEKNLMVKLLKPTPGQSLLDIGCGTGNHLKFFQEMGLKITGIDPSASMLKQAKEKLKNKASLFLGSGEKLPFEDKAFDLCIIFTTLEFCQNPSLLLKEAERVTSEKIFLGVLNSFSILSLQRRIKGWFKPSIYNKAKFYNIWELKRLIKKSFKFRSMKWGGVIFFPCSGFRWVDKILSFKKNPFNSFLGILVEL